MTLPAVGPRKSRPNSGIWLSWTLITERSRALPKMREVVVIVDLIVEPCGAQRVSGELLRRLILPLAIQSWSLTSLQQRLFKTGGRLIRHARYFTLQLAESHLTSHLFGQILGRIERLTWHPT